MTLCSIRWLFYGWQVADGTYRLFLTTHVLGTFRYVTMNLGDNGESVRNAFFFVGSDGVAFHDVKMKGRNCCKLPLKAEHQHWLLLK